MSENESDVSNTFRRSALTSRSPTRYQANAPMADMPLNDNALYEQMKKIEAMLSLANENIALLKAENIQLKKQLATNSGIDLMPTVPTRVYQTDEDELAEETKWTTVQRSAKRQKRPAQSPPENPVKTAEKTNTVPKKTSPQKVKKVVPPPPVNVIGVQEHTKIKEILTSSNAGECKLIALKNDVWKINTSNPDNYRNLVNYLNTQNIEWYTYEDKNDRLTKVMARGLHPTCDPTEIVDDLIQKGLQITNATNIKKKERTSNEEGIRSTKLRGLPLFMLTFKKEEDIHKIYTISSILNIKVKIEAIRKNSNQIPQCKKCQGFNHTEKYCHKNIKCVKCAENHPTKDCTRDIKLPAKCTNCNGQHPASYRGCDVAVQLQNLRNKAIKAKQTSIKPRKTIVQVQEPKTPVKLVEAKSSNMTSQPTETTPKGTKTYSEVLKLMAPVKETQQNLKEDQNRTQKTLEQILQKLENINERINQNTESIQRCGKNFELIFKYLDTKKTWKEYIK